MAWSVVQVRKMALDFSFVNNFSLFQLKSIKDVTKKVAHDKKNMQNWTL